MKSMKVKSMQSEKACINQIAMCYQKVAQYMADDQLYLIDHSYNWHISVVECVNHLESELRTRLDSVLLFHLYYSVQFCVYTWRISTKLGRNVCLTNDYLSINFLLVPCFDLWFLASFWFHKKNAITQIQ